MEKLNIPYPVFVEGKYDKIKLSSVIVGNIYTTNGFGLFKSGETKALIRKLAEKTPLIILTDSDGAGKVIRSHISSLVPKSRLIELYIPKIEGKEKRKTAPSAEGTLGVEGMEVELLRSIFEPFAIKSGEETPIVRENRLSKTDFFLDGLTGSEGAAEKRDALAEAFGLPSGMTANALLEALKMVATYEEYLSAVGREKE